MHKINVLTFGSENFNTSLEELKEFLNFKLSSNIHELEKNSLKDFHAILVHEDYIKSKSFDLDLIKTYNNIKILVCNSDQALPNFFHHKILLPTSIKSLNELLETSIAKRSFSKNSSIQIKGYILDKNEKRLKKDRISILLTEKEIQLLEIFLRNKKSISKNLILKEVWKYSRDVDTHTVETHIYRLRKKIKDEFLDDNFIINNKNGYSL